MKVVDSDIFIDFLRGVEEAKDFFINNAENIAFSAITEIELLSGKICNEEREREKILFFLSKYTKIPIDNPMTILAGGLRRKFNIPFADSVIAATAISNEATLITRNITDFKVIVEINLHNPY